MLAIVRASLHVEFNGYAINRSTRDDATDDECTHAYKRNVNSYRKHNHMRNFRSPHGARTRIECMHTHTRALYTSTANLLHKFAPVRASHRRNRTAPFCPHRNCYYHDDLAHDQQRRLRRRRTTEPTSERTTAAATRCGSLYLNSAAGQPNMRQMCTCRTICVRMGQQPTNQLHITHCTGPPFTTPLCCVYFDGWLAHVNSVPCSDER